MEPVKLGDLVLGQGSDAEGYTKDIIGMVVSEIPFREKYQRWVVEWSDRERTNHPVNIIRMMKDDLKRKLNG